MANGKNVPIELAPDFTQFSYSYTCLVVFLYLFILTARRDMSIFIKINTFGVIFTMIIITFIITVGITGLRNCDYEYTLYKDNNGADYVPNNLLPDGKTEILLFGSAYSHLMGVLGGGFYLHNISLPIYRASKNPKNNVRDMFLGFSVVCMSYIICGTLGALGFNNR